MILGASPLVMIKYWIFQGVLYMNNVERLHRLSVEACLFVLIGAGLVTVVDGSAAIVVSLVVAHTLSAFFNGHPFAFFAHDVYWFSLYRSPEKFMAYVEEMAARLQRRSPRYIRQVLVHGSITRGVFRDSSDLDVRYIASPGFVNGLLAANYVMLERMRAALRGFPIDAYMFLDCAELGRKMRIGSEPAVELYGTGDGYESCVSEPRTIADMKATLHHARPEKKPPRVLLVGAGGGHLTEGLLATEGIPMRRVIATFMLPHTGSSIGEDRCYYLIDPHGSLPKYALNFMQSLWVVLREKPDVVISTGGGVSIACSLLGKFLGARLIYVESGARVSTPSRTGKLLYRYADLFLVQWRPLLACYPGAVYGGVLS